MNIILIGIQGSGKGTLISELEKQYDFSLISVGQMFRDEIATGSLLGQKIKSIIDAGNLVSLDIVMDTLQSKLKNLDKPMAIFDGFPRTSEQADELDKIAKVDLVLYLNLSNEVAIDRILNRLTCSRCGYITKRSQVNSISCPHCSGELIQRSDDNKESINKRFEQYFSETYPLLERYKQRGVLVEIDANQEISKVTSQVVKVINEYNNKK